MPLQSTDTVVQQDQTWYDADGNSIATAQYELLPGASNTGALTATNSYVTASVRFYDAAGRDIDDVNYGRQDVIGGVATAFFNTNGSLIATNGNPTVSQGTPPAPDTSGHYVVSETVFNDTGAVGPMQTVNNIGVVTQTQSDLLGRTVNTIKNYVVGGLSNGLPVASDKAEDVMTAFQYDSSG